MDDRPGQTAVDPICGMAIHRATARVTYCYAGWTYCFCCEECLELFRQAPDTCVAYLAHSRTAHVGHRCPHLRWAGADR